MATKISAVMTVTDASNKQSSKSVTDISPNAYDYQIKEFIVALNGLTTNTLDDIDVVTKKSIMDIPDPNPHLSVTPTTKVISTFDSDTIYQLTYDGETREITVSGKRPKNTVVTVDNEQRQVIFQKTGNPYDNVYGMPDVYIYFTVAGNETYKEATVSSTITGAESSAVIDI